MEIFIAKNVGEVTESISVSGVKDVKEVLELYKGMSDNVVCKPSINQHTEVVLEDGSVAVSGMTLGESEYDSELLAGKRVHLKEFEIYLWTDINELKEKYKSDLGDTTYCLMAKLLSEERFDLSIEDIKLLHKEFGEIIKIWES